ncbi:acyl dehydratase [Rhodococcus sp. 05-340-1]|uniref:acyl dehydratase n=1 Tax=unclassified Rhodococcus (in: high G+C Gram-positive bacteria) TaxID=192944 RepID=UPI000B9B8EA5|nr:MULTISPECIES: acyl dehydratase [unclassified Rhodococcus (in: high G+C Gram-positive bacteria)]OZD71115.1 acyl dehydratase [Rhodococcus sp. 05-340-2]OZD74078.1 acyl dehydratase [Rhodococcus sp. 05-340-1]
MSENTVRSPVLVGGPYFDELSVGHVFDTAPTVTFTDGMAAVHQSILGIRLRLPLDAGLSRRVAGHGGTLVNPALVCDVAIGQSTTATHHVKANLFYRGLRFHTLPRIGDSLTTVTTVTGLRENSPKPGRRSTGLAALHMKSTDQRGRTVLDFHRCAMLPIGDDPDEGRVRHDDTLEPTAPAVTKEGDAIVGGLDLPTFRTGAKGPHFSPELAGVTFECSADVVTSAPELARLSLNIAATHHDQRSGPLGRLVYGGHTIGLALAQATRALPNIVTVLGWESCDHLAPVRENDTLTSTVFVERAEPLSEGGILHLRSVVHSVGDGDSTDVLDWRFSALMA